MTIKEQNRRGMRTFARAAVLTTLSAAMIGGGVLPGVASASTADAAWVALKNSPDTPERMHFTVNTEGGVARPGRPATVAVEWDMWNIWTQFQSDKAGNGAFNFWQDFAKVLASQTADLTLDGKPCAAFGDAQGGAEGFQQGKPGGGTNYEPIDFLGLAAQFRNAASDLAKGIIGDNVVSDFLRSKVRATCEFVVPKAQGTDITVGGNVALNNLAGLLHDDKKGRATLPIEIPGSPAAPTWSTAAQSAEVKEGGDLTGHADSGSTIRLIVDGAQRENPSVKTNADGYFTIKLPDDLKADSGHQIVATADTGNGSKPAASRPLFVMVKPGAAPAPAVAKPVVTSPTGDVRPGDGLTVAGTDGSVVTAVDQNGKVLGGPVEIQGGQARITLPAELADGSQVKIIAKQKDGSGEGVASDPKTVRVGGQANQSDSVLYQTLVPALKPGQTGGFLDINYEPRDGDVAGIGARQMTVKPPSGFSFGNVSYVVVGHNGNGTGVGLNNLVQRNTDGSITISLPSTRQINGTFDAGIKSYKISISTVTGVDAGATPGERTDGSATLGDITIPLKGIVLAP